MKLEKLHALFEKSKGVSIDTRKIQPGALFFALKGSNFNGNHFAEKALEQGASFLILDEAPPPSLPKDSYELVPDVLKTLQDLAHFHRQKLGIQVLSIGGSNGKTTTKELIYKVLSKKYRVFATPGNFNNHIGVALSLLEISEGTEIAIIELGANHVGEIAHLAKIADPDYGLITNIGKDHLEGFGSIEGVVQANNELFEYLAQKDGQVFFNSQEKYLAQLAKKFEKAFSYPAPEDDYHCSNLEGEFFVRVKSASGLLIQSQLFGEYNFHNIASALAIGHYFEVAPALAKEAIEEYQAQNNRSQMIKKRSNTLLLDAYNANPSSMQLALESFAKISAPSKMILLGDMNELGKYSQSEHEKLGDWVAKGKFDTVVFYGQEIRAALKANPQAFYFPDKFSLHNWISDRKLEHCHLLIKGSRSAKLETVVNFI